MRRLVLLNTGDIEAKFRWNIDKINEAFTITPESGVCSPGMETTFIVTFKPLKTSHDIRSEVSCEIENFKPLKLTLTGICINIPPAKEVEFFKCCVRCSDKKSITVHNKSNTLWELRPVLSGDYFSGPETIKVPPQSSAQYEVTYEPYTMTLNNTKHMGTVFFALPDGQGNVHGLQGISEPPKPNGRISRDVVSKLDYMELLKVDNWLLVPQKFRATFDVTRSEKLDPAYVLKGGSDFINVPANSSRDFRIQFMAYKECTISFKVTFTNESTGEYQFYEISYRVLRSGPIDTIKLITPARQNTTYMLALENPLPTSANFVSHCNNPEIVVPPTFQIEPHAHVKIKIEFLPLRVGETETKLEFTSPDLGVYPYELHLTAHPPAQEKAIHFSTTLGNNVSQQASFCNVTRTKAEFVCKLDNPDFYVDKSVMLAPGLSGNIDVTYEPVRIGSQHAMLTISSVTAGDFIYPLIGECSEPKPQGPFTLKPGGTQIINFRNVFPAPRSYSYVLDNPAFILKESTENMKPKKDHRVVVTFPGKMADFAFNQSLPVTGKLSISCTDPATGEEFVWAYYLKGVSSSYIG